MLIPKDLKEPSESYFFSQDVFHKEDYVMVLMQMYSQCSVLEQRLNISKKQKSELMSLALRYGQLIDTK